MSAHPARCNHAGRRRQPTAAPPLAAACVATLLMPGIGARAGELEEPPVPQATAQEQAAEGAGARLAPCPELAEDQEILEKMRTGVERSVCVTAWRVDTFFGNRDDEEVVEARAVYGRLRAGLLWDEQDGLDQELRLRATFPTPLLNKQLKAIVGRETDEEFIEDAPREVADTTLFGTEQDASWLFGFGYDPIRGRRSRLSLGMGLKLQSPLNPYVKASYRYLAEPVDELMVRLRQTVFWENEEGFGTSSRADVERLLDEGRLLRWGTYLKLSEDTDGVYWNTALTGYQKIGEGRALALRGSVRGETGRDVNPVEYRLLTIYRQRFLRDWLFLELRGGASWVRKSKDESRELVPQVGVIFEMVFGEHPRLRSLSDDG
ncbi:MAG TPA: hypothetical protein VLM41_06925 [Steroidobacteraceae bacterium]|nr:hypothetical protein [Steroidobacteraceae bacterium]